MSTTNRYLLATAFTLGGILFIAFITWGAASCGEYLMGRSYATCWPLPDSYWPLAIMGGVLCAAFAFFLFFAFIYACAQGLRDSEEE